MKFELTFKHYLTNEITYEVVNANDPDDAYRMADDILFDNDGDLELIDVQIDTTI